jgi:hypothetical protein
MTLSPAKDGFSVIVFLSLIFHLFEDPNLFPQAKVKDDPHSPQKKARDIVIYVPMVKTKVPSPPRGG